MAKILVVDQDAQLRELLLRQLQFLGHEPIDGGEAGEIPGAGHGCDLVVLDPLSPEARRAATLLRLRFPELPLVFLSLEEPSKETAELGPVRHLVKPVSLAELEGAIVEALEATRPD